MQNQATLVPDAKFLKQMTDEIKMNVNVCYQCRKCSAGCPMSYAMDYTPAQLIHAIRLGLKDLVMNSKTMWMCSSCQTCTTRCPQEVEIAKVMDTIKIMAVNEGIKPPVSRVHNFNKAALSNIKWFSRMYELGMIGELKLRNFPLDLFKDMGLGIKMFKKGKMAILPNLRFWPWPWTIARTYNIFARVKRKEKQSKSQKD